MTNRCKRCNRVLTNSLSIERGFVPTCYKIIQLNTPKPEISNDFGTELNFLKMEIKTLKNIVRNINLNGNNSHTAIERIKLEESNKLTDPDIFEYRQVFAECVKELKEVLKERRIKIEQSTNLNAPPHVISVVA